MVCVNNVLQDISTTWLKGAHLSVGLQDSPQSVFFSAGGKCASLKALSIKHCASELTSGDDRHTGCGGGIELNSERL